MDRLQSMATFVAVVDTGGFARAARKLGLSPPVVTRAIAELEARLGVRLLARTTRAVRVTDAGARYVDECRRLLAEIDDADEAASGAHASPRGQLTVTAPVLFGRRHVMPIVVEHLRRHPDVETNCLFLDRIVNLVEEGADVAVRIGTLPDSSLQAVTVGRVRRMVVASPAYLASHGVPREPADLDGHVIVVAGGLAPTPEWRFVREGGTLVQRVQPRVRTTTNDSAIEAAVAGFGVTRLLGYQVAEHVAAGTLIPLLETFEPAPLPVSVVHREGRRASQKVRTFVDLAVEMLRADAALA